MRINVADRFRPFSNHPGAACILPGSFLKFQFFPAKFKVFNAAEASSPLIGDYAVNIQGPVTDFTVQLDLEKGLLKVWGHSPKGYFRYTITSAEEGKGFLVSIDKSPVPQLIYPAMPSPSGAGLHISPQFETLSLGVNKKQEWQHILERCSLPEILPIWFRAGQFLPSNIVPTYSGTASLLKSIEASIKSGDIVQTSSSLTDLFLSGMQGVFAPRLTDEDFQGFQLPSVPDREPGSPLYLLSHGASLIRSLFIQQNKSHISILPHLLPQLQCGRMTNIHCSGVGLLELEWRKKSVRRMILHSETEAELHFIFQKGIKHYRLRQGKDIQKMNAGTPIKVFAEKEYLFDNFQ